MLRLEPRSTNAIALFLGWTTPLTGVSSINVRKESSTVHRLSYRPHLALCCVKFPSDVNCADMKDKNMKIVLSFFTSCFKVYALQQDTVHFSEVSSSTCLRIKRGRKLILIRLQPHFSPHVLWSNCYNNHQNKAIRTVIADLMPVITKSNTSSGPALNTKYF